MKIEAQEITAIIGVIGLVLAAVLSSVGYLYRGWVESKRSARKVLYLLLEIRYALGASMFDAETATDKYIDHYAEKLQREGVEVSKEEFQSHMGEMINQHFKKLAEASKTDIQNRLLIQFEDALSDLSQVSPVLAYRLKGKEKLEGLARLTESYVDSFEVKIESELDDELVKEEIIDFVRGIKNDTLNMMSEKLDEDIAMLSKQCGWLEEYKCKKVLSYKFGSSDKEMFSELDKIIDKMIKKWKN